MINASEKISIDELSSIDIDSIPDPLSSENIMRALLEEEAEEQAAKEAAQVQDLCEMLALVLKRAEIFRRLRKGEKVTHSEVLLAGFEYVTTSMKRGYISRKSTGNTRTAYLAGGRRKGLIAVMCPSWDSTIYCYVKYYRAPQL